MPTFNGTPGNDVYQGTQEGDDIIGAAGNDRLSGGGGDDHIEGNDGNDVINGDAGDDEIYGGAGRDTLSGGSGDDRIVVSESDTVAGETYAGGSGYDLLNLFTSSADFSGSTITGMEVLYSDYNPLVTMTAAQIGQFLALGKVQLTVSTAGEIDLTNANIFQRMSFTLNDGGNSLILADTGDAAVVTVIGGSGDDTVFVGDGGGGSLVAHGNGGDDTLTGGSVIDEIYGGDGDDTLSGAGGSDRIDGDDGNDVVNGDAGDDEISGGAGRDTLSGGSGDDRIVVRDSDTVAGETYDGGSGYDLLNLYTFTADFSGSTITGMEVLYSDYNPLVTMTAAQIGQFLQLGKVRLTVSTAGEIDLTNANIFQRMSFTLNDGGNNLILADTGNAAGVTVIGGSGDDTVFVGDGGGGSLVAHGNGGDDTLTGGSVIDEIYGGDGDDTLSGAGGSDRIDGDDGNDVVNGDAGDDEISGGAGRDTLSGGSGDDRIVVRDSDTVAGETYDGGSGYDLLNLYTFTADFSGSTITGMEVLYSDYNPLVTMTAAQIGQFLALGKVQLTVSTAGEIDLTNANIFQRMSFTLNDGGNNLILADTGDAAVVTVIGGSGDDTVFVGDGGGGSLVAHGNAGDDTLTGGSVIDEIYGGDGDDMLSGGAGGDHIEGNDGNDRITVDKPGDIVAGELYDGGADDDVLYLNFDADGDLSGVTLAGIEAINQTYYGHDTRLTAAQLDAVARVSGRSFTLTSGGSVSMAGGTINVAAFNLADAGNTLDLTGSTQSGLVTVNGGAGADVVTGGMAADTLNGGGGDDRLAGADGADVLKGGEGADRLDGGAGGDAMTGGAGDDTYVVDVAADKVYEYAGGGIDSVEASISYILRANVENLLLTGSAAIDGTGNTAANTITGNDAANRLNGGTGDDILSGNGGADTLIGGAGADTLAGGAGDDLYVIADAGDIISEFAGGGYDTVQSSIDYVLPDQVEKLVLRGPARSGTGNALDNLLLGSDGADSLRGLDGADSIQGNSGTDQIDGGAGDDTLAGGSGRDVLTGGAGADRFVFRANDTGAVLNTADRILDFSHAQGDRISLAAIDAITASAGDDRFTFIGTAAFNGVAGQLRYAIAGGDTLIEGDVNGDGVADVAIRLAGHLTLVAGDFVL